MEKENKGGGKCGSVESYLHLGVHGKARRKPSGNRIYHYKVFVPEWKFPELVL